ncbi:hypothetical protein BH23ACT8_BH23ACT8_15640 [soil metagenome]
MTTDTTTTTDEAVTRLGGEGYPRADVETLLEQLLEAGNVAHDDGAPRWAADHLDAVRLHMDTIPGYGRVTYTCSVCGRVWSGLAHQLGDADVIPGRGGRAYCTGHADGGEVAADLRAASAWFGRAADLLDAGDIEQAWRTADLGRFGAEGIVGRIRTLG